MIPRSLILMKWFWFCDRFSEAMSFSRFALLSQESQFTYQKCSIVWLPRVNCQFLLCKAKPARIIKRSIHYVTLQHYNPGELLKEIPPCLKWDVWYKRSKFWKYLNLGVILQKKIMFYSLMHSIIWFSSWHLLTLVIVSVVFILGHPV